MVRAISQFTKTYSPIFERASGYSTSIPESSQPGTFVIQVTASDKDSGSYGAVSYFLLSELGAHAPSFRINETTGVITVNGPLDRERKPFYSLTVQAVDDYTGHLNPDSHEATAIVSGSFSLAKFQTPTSNSNSNFNNFQSRSKSV